MQLRHGSQLGQELKLVNNSRLLTKNLFIVAQYKIILSTFYDHTQMAKIITNFFFTLRSFF